MPQVSDSYPERSRKIASTILTGLHRVGQVRVAEHCECSESKISKWKSEDLENAARIIAACGMKVVPIEKRCFDQQQIAAILTLAKQHMASIESPDQLTWEE